jgi:hypothetical protein
MYLGEFEEERFNFNARQAATRTNGSSCDCDNIVLCSLEEATNEAAA